MYMYLACSVGVTCTSYTFAMEISPTLLAVNDKKNTDIQDWFTQNIPLKHGEVFGEHSGVL